MISGGIRSIVQLATLKELERVIKLDMPIQDFFDLIIGTRYNPSFNFYCTESNREVAAAE
jgi:hypothetical protein